MRTALLLLIVSAFVGFATWRLAPAETVAPLDYDVPVRVVAQDAQSVTFKTRRCNNTGKDLVVTVTATWESLDHTLIPVLPASAGATSVPPGCVDRGGTPVSISYLPSGTWRLRGSVCAVDVCGGWQTDWIVKP